jgi:hypothetical protein
MLRPEVVLLVEEEEEDVAEGVVMFTGVVEKSEPWRERVCPVGGCWVHPAVRAVRKFVI